MNHKKLLLTLTLCLCALLCMVVTASASEVSGHSHRVCEGTKCTDPAHNGNNHGSVTFEKALTMNDDGVLCIGGTEAQKHNGENYDYILQGGTYYLDGDLILHGGIQVNGSVTLCLNGHAISNDYSHVIQTPWGRDATFTLCDCEGEGKIAHVENSESTGTGVSLNNTSGKQQIFVMYNGCITQNKGSGVYLYQNTSFTMYGGRITQNGYNNTSQWGVNGGGVYVHNGATFTMYGGDITKNQADYGGGVSTSDNTANFTMYGGSITENHANKSGGGIYSTSNKISIYGGGVTNNSVTKTGNAGGIYVSSSGTLTVGGNVNISGNWQGDSKESGSKNNVYLDYYKDDFATIVIEKELTGENSSIGVTTATPVATTKDASVKIAAGKGTHAITDADKGRFTPDTGYCEVQKKDDGALYLTHVHAYGAVSYTWATDYTTCKAEHKCTACQHVENETVNTQKQVTQNRSCTLDELTTFTATFTNSVFAQQTKEKVKTADMTGHTYSTTEWKSNVDNHWHECSVCHTQIGKAEHNWKDATTSAPKTCTVCGATTGTKLSAYYYYSPAKTEDTPGSPKAGDPGVLLYAGLALASLTGLACTAKKRH